MLLALSTSSELSAVSAVTSDFINKIETFQKSLYCSNGNPLLIPDYVSDLFLKNHSIGQTASFFSELLHHQCQSWMCLHALQCARTSAILKDPLSTRELMELLCIVFTVSCSHCCCQVCITTTVTKHTIATPRGCFHGNAINTPGSGSTIAYTIRALPGTAQVPQ